MLALGGQILHSGTDQSSLIAPGVVEIEDDRVSAVHFGPISARVDFGGDNTLICPGLIDTHLHLPQFDSIGAAKMPLLAWLHQVIFPAESRWNDAVFAKSMIDRVAKQCLAVGTTGICAYATVDHQSTLAALQAFGEIGFRGVIGQVMMDRDAPPELLRPADQLIDEVGRTLDRFPASGRMAAAVTPRFALSCSQSLLDQAGALAATHGALIQTHLAETTAECAAVDDQFGGRAYAGVYQDAGLLTHRSLLGHAIHLDASSQQRLADSGAMIAHCPTANSFLGSGTMNRRSHLAAGIPITLGSDIGAGYERSMVRVGRAMIDAAMRIATTGNDRDASDFSQVPSAAQAWHQITAGNADVLGWTDAGQLRSGAQADVIVIDPDIPWRQSPDPLATLMFSWDDRWLSQTILRGRLRYSHRSLSP